MIGVLVFAALNAISYFARSELGGNLLGNAPHHREALGFPFEMWESGNNFDGYFVDLGPLAANLGLGLLFASTCGAALVRCRRPLDQLEQELLASFPEEPSSPLQFSLRNLMVFTAIFSVVAAAARYAQAGRPEVLGAFYLFGPWLLVIIPFLPDGLTWQRRVVLVVPFTLMLMAGGVAIGQSLTPVVEFDKILLGTFLCWTPQSVVAAVVITLVVLWHWRRTRHRRPAMLASSDSGAELS